MQRIFSSDLNKHLGQKVNLRGWLNNLRAFGKLNFLILRDKNGFSQIVIEDKEELKKISHLHPGSILKITGEVISNSQADLGVEIINPILRPKHDWSLFRRWCRIF